MNSTDTQNNLKPIKRSKLRLVTGKAYYSLVRYMLWHGGRFKFAKNQSDKYLEHVHFSNKTSSLIKLLALYYII